MLISQSCYTLAATCDGVRWLGPDAHINGLCADSRQIRPGALFAALSGSHTSGSRFVEQALAAGAVAVLHDGSLSLPDSLCQIIHPEPRVALALLAAAFYGQPSRTMTMLAITGTNGKTSTAAMIEAILKQQEPYRERVGVIGTTGIRGPGIDQPNPLTTPDPVALQASLQQLQNAGCRAVVMEVSSHALEQRRTAGIFWQVALFTHLTRDHLDYHGTEAAYFASKAALFTRDQPARAVIGIDDPWGVALAEQCHAKMPMVTFQHSCPPASANPTPHFCASQVQLSWQASRFQLHGPDGQIAITLPSPGRFNVANAVAAAATCWQLGIPLAAIQSGLANFQPAPGRMQTIQAGQPFAVLIDYAHTPDALERLLLSTRHLTAGRMIVLFGCGGDRDRGKRPLMGAIAARLADHLLITDDNPRSEDPSAIRQEVLAGCRSTNKPTEEIADREQAIRHALTLAQPGDALLLVGKGHERVQITANGSFPFDDAEIARLCLAEKGYPATP
ncbi:MAG: UDP-N-acetylmuramoyl-L-alanyl-D-glutamate--2,6-diaminopimelate ligase [Magnetococcales bacterium]|nr:UDP-N-acetylmuramoyl-L-alanyl-D-glutamate--2,6-diaminopimelate ligase [Magnetococcales bacterium]MBF0113606.1 UDP-N-acetylmuramoyl-L-alanyl-D-glutamate--2,6-diaminopimelate ligase [Magnetococcales bacterium]